MATSGDVLPILYEQLSRTLARAEGRIALVNGVCHDCDQAIADWKRSLPPAHADEVEAAVVEVEEAAIKQDKEVADGLDAILRRAKSARGVKVGPVTTATTSKARPSTSRASGSVPAAAKEGAGARAEGPTSSENIRKQRALKELHTLRSLLTGGDYSRASTAAAATYQQPPRPRSAGAQAFMDMVGERAAQRRHARHDKSPAGPDGPALLVPLPRSDTITDPVGTAVALAALECYDSMRATLASVPQYSKYNAPSNLARLFAVVHIIGKMNAAHKALYTAHRAAQGLAERSAGHAATVGVVQAAAAKAHAELGRAGHIGPSALTLPGETTISRFGLVLAYVPPGMATASPKAGVPPVVDGHRLSVLARARQQLCQMLVHGRLEEYYADALLPILQRPPPDVSERDLMQLYRLAHALLLAAGRRATTFVDKQAYSRFLANPVVSGKQR